MDAMFWTIAGVVVGAAQVALGIIGMIHGRRTEVR